MKILQVIANAEYGGLPVHTLTLSRCLAARGHEVCLLSLCDGPVLADFEAVGIPTRATPFLELKAQRNIFLAWRAIRYVQRTIDSFQPDIIHSHGPRAHFFTVLAAVSMKRRNQMVASVHGSWRQFSGGHEEEMGAVVSLMKKVQYGGIDRLTASLSQKIVAVCEATRDELIKTLRINGNKIIVVPNGSEDCDFDKNIIDDIRMDFGISETDKVVICVGRIAFHKGSQDLLDAIDIIAGQDQTTYFLVVGEGPMEAELRRRAQDVKFGGRLLVAGRRNDALGIMAASDLVVLPSLSEGLPLTLLEAAMLGKPIVATEVGGVREIVIQDRTGLLVRPHDPKGLANAIQQLLGDEKRRRIMGVAARELWERKFRADLMVSRMEELYGAIAGK